MSENEEMEEYHEAHVDFPHEDLMDELDLSIDQLDASIQREIKNFDKKYMDAFVDGTITEREMQELVTLSYEIAKNIQKEIGQSSSKLGKGIFAGILLAIGAYFGIKQMNQP